MSWLSYAVIGFTIAFGIAAIAVMVASLGGSGAVAAVVPAELLAQAAR